MKFIEMTGARLKSLLGPDELDPAELARAGVDDECVVRVNEQGDIEIRRPDGWDVVGGLLGDFAERIRSATGFDWA